MGSLREILLFAVPAEETVLGRIGRIYEVDIRTSIRSFVAYELPGLVPRGIENRFRSAAEFRIQRLNHRPDVQVFQGDVIVSINIVSAPLVQEVVPPVLHLLVDPGNRDPLLAAVPAALHCPG
nr:hypothetical protein [Methanoculleus sp. UBA303]